MYGERERERETMRKTVPDKFVIEVDRCSGKYMGEMSYSWSMAERKQFHSKILISQRHKNERKKENE